MRRLFSHILLISLLAMSAWLVWLFFTLDQHSPDTPLTPHEATNSGPLSITGLSYYDYQNDRLLSHIQVEKIEVRSRSFSGLRIHALNEIFLQDAKFDLYQALNNPPTVVADNETTSAPELSLSQGLSSNISNLAKVRGAGRITRALFEGIVLKVIDEQELYLTLKADKAVLDFRKQSVEFTQAVLSGRDIAYQIASPDLHWNEESKVFELPGDYLLIFEDRVFRGRSAQVTTSFQIRVHPGGMAPEQIDVVKIPQTAEETKP